MDILEFIRDAIGNDEYPYNLDHSPQKVERWREYEVVTPRESTGHAGHECFWTAAPGIWTCRDCGEWYRTWTDEPERPPQQEQAENLQI